jgi:predicted dehydrogenase
MKSGSSSRREFLLRAAVAASAASAWTRPAHGAQPRVAANDKIVLGFIGVGGMGRSHFDRLLNHPGVVLAAAVDTDRQRQDAARAKAAERNVPIKTYTDFREMLHTHPDIDAVFVATPDHWHALAAIACIQAGKDVYCEKPLALTIAEGRALVEAARRYDRVVQVGTQQRSDQKQFLHACELVRNGRIGQLQKIVCFFGPNPQIAYVPNEEPPPYLDWDRYLGPAPWRPFNRMIHPYNFRYFRDYSGGLLTDWGVHLFDIAQWGAGKDATSPSRIEAEGEMYLDNFYEFPRTCRIQFDYRDLVLEWSQGMGGTVEPAQGYGTKFYGTEGEVFVNRGGYAARGKTGAPINEILGPKDERLYNAPGHHQDFFDCMRTRHNPICDVAIGHRATAISHLGNIAFRLGRPLVYDPVREIFPGDAPATSMIAKPMRAPWHL